MSRIEGPEDEDVVNPPPEDMMPWTATIEVTMQAEGADDAEAQAAEMLDYLVSAYDGLAGAVMKVEPNE
jgi:hypothetical protein